MISRANWSHGELFAACVDSLWAAAIKPAKDELTAEQSAARQQHIADGLATLREAIAAGQTLRRPRRS